MKKKSSFLYFLLSILLFSTLSCSLFSSIIGGDSPAETAKENEPVEISKGTIINQWASSARASSEYANPDWSANQATGAPDTLECGDFPTAWAPFEKFTTEWLEVTYETPVIPTEINIYETHVPTQVVRVEILDTQGMYHNVYNAQPKIADCPYILSVPVGEVDYQAIGIKITIDQSQLNLPWDEIDAVELIGYADASPDLDQNEEAEKIPDNPPTNSQPSELPLANPQQDASFSMGYSGCNEDGKEDGSDIEVSVHDDRIDIRLRGIHKKYALITLPRNLEDGYKDNLTEFLLEGRVPPSAGLYIRSVWWYGEKGRVETYFNDDGTLSGSVDFEGTRKQGCDFKTHIEFEHIVLRE